MNGLILLAAFLFCITAVVGGIKIADSKETVGGVVIGGVFILIGIIGIVGLLVLLTSIDESKPNLKPIEYPASEYTLELKITEFQGQADTTYVLIRKEK